MGEPARRLEDIEPDIRPNFNVLQGGGQSTPERASLKALNNLESNPEKLNTGSIDEQESNGSNTPGPWVNNYTGKREALESQQIKRQRRGKAYIRLAKRKGPLTAIILTIVGGGIGICGLLSPGLLLVQIKEVMVDKFNTQLTSLEIRTIKKLANKTTSGSCSTVKILCKYQTMSDKQVANFKNAGIEVVSDGETNILGRTKPKSFVFEGNTVEAKNFTSKMYSDVKFRSAVKLAYNPKFAGFADNIWKKAAGILKISKRAPTIEGDTYDEKLKSVESDIKETTGLKKSANVNEGDIKDPNTGAKYTKAEADAANIKINKFNELIDLAGGDGSTASKILNGVTEVENLVKLTGPLDDGCTLYRTSLAIGYAAKTVRVIQLASFAMLFLNVADQIKAGVATPDDVSFLGTILTNESLDQDSGVYKSATDSFGYKHAAYGDTGSMPTSTMQFMAAAGFSGVMVNFLESFPNVKGVCTFLGNPLVGLASLIGGGILAFFSGGASLEVKGTLAAAKASFKIAVKEAVKTPAFWKGIGLAFAEVFLPNLLKDIVSGSMINETTVGANAGDAITSGASGIMGTTAKFGGNAPLTPTQAVAYSNLSSTIAAQYAEEDQLAYGQFDASNNNTFIGKITAQLTPYLAKMSSLSGFFSSLMSMTTNSFALLTPSAVRADSANNYSMCQDSKYRELGLATDPFCNITYGIPIEALNTDPIDVTKALLDQTDPQDGVSKLPQIDSETGDPLYGSAYANFVSECIDNTDPLEKTNDKDTSGERCLFGNDFLLKKWTTIENGISVVHRKYISNSNFYLHYIDQRVENGMDGQ